MSDFAINAICTLVGGLFGGLLAHMGTAIANRAKRDEAEIKLKELELRLKYEHDQKESYKAIAKDGIVVLERVTNEKLASEGKPTIVRMADVLANHHSLVTKEGKESAEFETMKAQMAAARLILDFPPKEPGEVETEEQRAARLTAEAKSAPKETSETLGARLTTVQIDQLHKKIEKVPDAVVEKLKEEGEA